MQRKAAESATLFANQQTERAEQQAHEKAEALKQVAAEKLKAEQLAREKAQEAADKEAARQAARTAQIKAEKLAARARYDQAMAYLATGEHRRGMLWLVRALEELQDIPGGDDDLERHIRLALSAWQHSYRRPRMMFEGRGYARYAALAPDGQSAAVYSRKDGLRLWHTVTGKPIGELLDLGGAGGDSVSVEGYSPDGQWLAVRIQNEVRLFDAQGKLQHVLKHPGNVSEAKFSPSGPNQLATSTGPDVYFWDVTKGIQVGSPLSHEPYYVTEMEFSPNGQRLAVAVRGRSTKVWNVNGGQLLYELPVYAAQLTFIGQALVARDGLQLHAFRADNGATIRKRVGRNIRRMAATNAGGGKLVTVDGQGILQHWQMSSDGLEPFGEPRPQAAQASALAFSSQGNVLVIAAGDEGVWLWDEHAERHRGPALQGAGVVQDVQIGGDTTLLTVSSDGGVRIWDLVPPQRFKPLAEASGWRLSDPPAVFSRDGRYLLTRALLSQARLWSVESGQAVGPALDHGHTMRAMAFADGGKKVMTAGEKTIRAWEVPGGKMLSETPLDPPHKLSTAAFSPDLRSLVASGIESCGVWDVATGKQLWQTSWRDGGWPRAISRDSRWFAVARSLDGSQDVAVFDLRTGAERRSLNMPRGAALSFSPNGQLLAATIQLEVFLWDINAGKLWGEPLGHLDRVVSLDWSPDGSQLLTSGLDRTARIWDVATGRSVREFQHSHDVTDAVFGPSGGIIATMDEEGTRLWDAQTGQPLGSPLANAVDYARAVFSPSGDWLFVGGRLPRLWPVPRPLEMDGRRLRDWVEWLTGMRLDEDNVARPLTASQWQQRKVRLERVGVVTE
jgi:WD40 repeat protein